MSFDWTQYLFLARELTKGLTSSSNHEAKLRSAISRARLLWQLFVMHEIF